MEVAVQEGPCARTDLPGQYMLDMQLGCIYRFVLQCDVAYRCVWVALIGQKWVLLERISSR